MNVDGDPYLYVDDSLIYFGNRDAYQYTIVIFLSQEPEYSFATEIYIQSRDCQPSVDSWIPPSWSQIPVLQMTEIQLDTSNLHQDCFDSYSTFTMSNIQAFEA